MNYNATHWYLLEKAAERIRPTDFDGYFGLKDLLASKDHKDRREFQRRFASYYRLHNAGLTDAFKKRYFTLFFEFQPRQKDPYTSLLLELYNIPRRKGDHSIQASFVSKMVAMRDESRPLFDRHVSNFFGLSVPSVGSVQFRIAGFVRNLQYIQANYETWAADDRFRRITTVLFDKHPRLQTCHPTRVCDFLVWTVGDREIE